MNLVAKAYDEEDPTALCDYAVRLGDEADKLAAAEPLVTPQRAIESLRRIKRPEKAPYIDDSRLLKLAAAASDGAAVSSRMEIYPRGMAAGRALKLAIGALSGSTQVTLDQIRERVHGRYPSAEPLPARPELDQLLKEAGWTLRWDDTRQAYVLPTEVLATTTFTSTLPRYGTVHTVPLRGHARDGRSPRFRRPAPPLPAKRQLPGPLRRPATRSARAPATWPIASGSTSRASTTC